jgi:hypothetical protein
VSGRQTKADADGWKRGAGPYSRSYPKLDKPDDYSYRSKKGTVSLEPGERNAGYSASLKQGNSPNRYPPKSPSAVQYNDAQRSVKSPTGKFKQA